MSSDLLAEIPYIYVPSKEALGLSSLTKRPTSVILVKQHDNLKKDYERVEVNLSFRIKWECGR